MAVPVTILAVGRRMKAKLATAFLVLVVFCVVGAGPAGATWSVVAVDEDTGEVGAAIASCVDGSVLSDPSLPLALLVLVPNEIAAVTQGQLNVATTQRIRVLHDGGLGPDAILADITGPEFDVLASQRQHAVVAWPQVGDDGASPVALAYTGADSAPAALDRQGSGVSVQGNLLASERVVEQSLAAYQTTVADGGLLADALVAALAAGSNEGGDRRCGEQTALFAQMAVRGRGGASQQTTADDEAGNGASDERVLTVLVDQGAQNPVTELADAYAAGRTGVVDLRERSNSGVLVRLAFGLAGVAAAVAGVIMLRRGMGSVRARR